MPQHITLITSDGVELAGLYRNTGQRKIAILLHMMPATKESWNGFAERLEKDGYASLAIDQRGHGESTMGGTLNYKQFSDEQQQAKRLDVEAAIAYARAQGFDEARMVVMGASIGANLAIRALVDHPGIPVAVALSPGLDYHGVLTEPLITQLHEGQRAVLAASDDDPYSFKSVRTLHAVNPSQTVLIERFGLGHGTTMTDKDASLVDDILQNLLSL